MVMQTKKPAAGKTSAAKPRPAKAAATPVAKKAAPKKTAAASSDPKKSKPAAARKAATPGTAKKAATPAARTRAPAKQVTAKPPAPANSPATKPTPEERYRMVETAAYFIAEQHGFQGRSDDHWAAAERAIAAKLGQ